MKYCLFILLFSLTSLAAVAQQEDALLIGSVSFITSNRVYAKFDDTGPMRIGDTLLSSKNGVMMPCLVIENKSSSSFVCHLLEGCDISKGATLYFNPRLLEPMEPAVKLKGDERSDGQDSLTVNAGGDEQEEKKSGIESRYREKIRGRISAASYSNLSDTYDDRHRSMMRFSFRGDHLQNTPLSLDAYLNYRQNFTISNEGENSSEGLFRVYNLALSYDVDTTFKIVLGRKINRRASSLGAIDGVQAEKQFGPFYTGVIAGFRPDLYDYGLNTNLYEYGAYGGIQNKNPGFYTSTTLGYLEQRNNGPIDRRYIYFQHNSAINRTIYLFASMETDLYQKVNGTASFAPRLTNLYLSGRYRFSRFISLTLSYDSRRNIIYYETLKTEVERLLDDDETRRGARARVNLRPIKYMSSGFSYSKRFKNDRQDASENINGYISYYRMPLIDGRMSVRFNWNQSAYLESRILSFRYSRSIIKRTLDADAYVRLVHYKYLASTLETDKYYYGIRLNYRIGRLWMFNVLYELSTSDNNQMQRVNTKIIRRLGFKRK